MLLDCERNRVRLVDKMAKGRYSEVGEAVKHIKDLALASVQLSRESRAWVKEKRELGKNLSIGEQIDLATNFVSKLSPPDRRLFFSRIDVYRDV